VKKGSKIEFLGCVWRITRRVGWEEMVRSEEGVEEKEMAKVREPRGREWWARDLYTCRERRKNRQRIWLSCMNMIVMELKKLLKSILAFLVIVKSNKYSTICNKDF